ncbi:bacteriocin [Ferruginibacter sp.]|nr:bacteriocin [Ferruginibacter sp.]
MKELSRKELKQIKGGDDCGTCPKFNCQCNGTGTWSGNYCTASEIANDIVAYCSGGGTCTAA